MGLPLWSLIRGDYNAAPYGSVCAIAPRPFDCIAQDRETCTRGKYADMTVLFSQIIPYAICFLMLVYVLSSLTYHVYSTESQLTPFQDKNKGSTDGDQGDEDTSNNDSIPPTRKRYESIKPITIDPLNVKRLEMVLKTRTEEEVEHSVRDDDDKDQVNKLENDNAREPDSSSPSQNQPQETTKMKITKEAAKQSTLYVCAFLLIYIGPIIELANIIANDNRNEISFWITSIFYPIGGLLNMIIYTRPKVQALKKLVPELPMFFCFVSVVLYGGEVPSIADLISDCDDPPVLQVPNAAPPMEQDELPRHDNDEGFEQDHYNKKKKKQRDSMASWIERLGWGDLISYSSEEFDSRVERAMREFEAM